MQESNLGVGNQTLPLTWVHTLVMAVVPPA